MIIPTPCHGDDIPMFQLPEDDVPLKASSKKMVPEKNDVRLLLDVADVEKTNVDGWRAGAASIDAKGLSKAIFVDQKWSNGMAMLKNAYADVTDTALVHASICDLLREGAASFGFWHLSDKSLEKLANQVLIGTDRLSADGSCSAFRTESVSVATVNWASAKKLTRGKSLAHMGEVNSWTNNFGGGVIAYTNWVICFGVLCICIGYAAEVCFHKYPGAIDMFGWPIFIARAGGMGAVLWTGLIYLSMARTFFRISFLTCARPGSLLGDILDCHKELHMFFGKMVLFTGIIHTVAHCVGTVPGIMTHTAKEINDLIGCNNPSTPGYLNVKMSWLSYPKCPLPLSAENMTYTAVVFTTVPGLTGVLLLAAICVVAWSARSKSRKESFERFWYIHQVAIVLWPILLFVHGSNGWLGIGFPLVVFVCGLPILFYFTDRVLRVIRYFSGTSKILNASIRFGKGSNHWDGAMMCLRISHPRTLWYPLEGSYAFLNCKEISRFQWHPFTICSGRKSETVDFIIMGAGDWTQDLIRRVYLNRTEGAPLPSIAMDGPFSAPTTFALKQEVFVGIGGGVGITPMLSLLETLQAKASGPRAHRIGLREAHFFWTSRSAEEFLFGKTTFTHILRERNLETKIFIHLHVTHKEGPKDGAAFIFRESLRRQSKIDRESFKKSHQETDGLDVSPETPWCWANGGENDILWANALIWHKSEEGKALKKLRTFEISEELQQCTSSFSSCLSDESRVESYMPVMLGRPDFDREILAIGRRNQDCDVHAYVCANDLVVKSVREACEKGNVREKNRAEKDRRPVGQNYCLHFERFG
eukprot:TRINITY_DN4737_c0_g1_i8.p1 TRINITY_DN4737_c0_g1~~TRINITY_DN4737_c0_g1_i8.p1  ORF type:complete len:816 (+),score=96.17 TRINITY_DN4737_c0_g1_i8:66-2513(+)